MRTRLAIGVTLLVLLAGAAVALGLSWRRDSGPPGVSAGLVRLLDTYQDVHIVVDEAATEKREDEARLLATRFGPSKAEPTRRVLGVSLAQFQGKLVWVVATKGPAGRCFAAVISCGGDDGEEIVINVLYSKSMTFWQSLTIDDE